MDQVLIVISTAVSALAALSIAVLTLFLVRATNRYVEETIKYRQSAEQQLELLRQQWSYQISPQVFLDLKTPPRTLDSTKLVVYCHNYGKPEVFLSEIEMNITDEGKKGRLFRKDVKRPLMSGEAVEIDVTEEAREGVMKRSRGPIFTTRGDLAPDAELRQIRFSASRDVWVTYYCLGNRHQIRHSGPISLDEGVWDVSLPEPEF